MNYKTEYFYKKPINHHYDKQLIAEDVNIKGAKRWFFSTYDELYQIILNKKDNNYYEDNTYNNKIKLFVDIDYHIKASF